MNNLLVSDLHLTAAPRDEYRWALFQYIEGLIPTHDVKFLWILGDLTDAKDYHSAVLVNRIVHSLVNLFQRTGLIKIYILRGNHDGIDPGCPYFGFLGRFPFIEYVTMPISFEHGSQRILMLPHSRAPQQEWGDIIMHDADVIFLHATVQGSVVENGQQLDGLDMKWLRQRAPHSRMYSGDIHVPQKVGPLTYVGSPYPVRFGDSFEPRAVLLDTNLKETSIPLPHIQRRTVVVDLAGGHGVLGLDGLKAGDQVKVRYRLAPAQFMDWQNLKRGAVTECEKLGIELCGIELEKVEQKKLVKRGTVAPVVRSPETVLAEYAARNKIDPGIAEAGLELLKGVL